MGYIIIIIDYKIFKVLESFVDLFLVNKDGQFIYHHGGAGYKNSGRVSGISYANTKGTYPHL